MPKLSTQSLPFNVPIKAQRNQMEWKSGLGSVLSFPTGTWGMQGSSPFPAWHPHQPLLSHGQGQQQCQGLQPLCLWWHRAVPWPGTAGWGGGHSPGAPGQAQSSAPLGAGITALPAAQTDGEPAQLCLLGLFGHCRELIRPARIWLAGVHPPNANIWDGGCEAGDETPIEAREGDLPHSSSWHFLTWRHQTWCSGAFTGSSSVASTISARAGVSPRAILATEICISPAGLPLKPFSLWLCHLSDP